MRSVARIVPVFFISVLLAFYFFNNLIWLGLNTMPPVGDEAQHLCGALDCFTVLTDASRTLAAKLYGLFHYRIVGFYPPLFHFLAASSGLAFGMSIKVSVMTNIFFIALSFVSIYLIGKRIQGRGTGILAVFIFSMYPLVFWLSRTFMLETALCALVTASFLALLCSEGFTRRGYSLLFGILVAAGMLVKQVFILNIIGPAAAMAVYSLAQQKERRGRLKVLGNISFSLAFLAGIFMSWYLPGLDLLFPRYIEAGYQLDTAFSYPLFSLDSLLFYPRLFLEHNLLTFFSLLFCAALVALIARKTRHTFFLFCWIFSIILVFTLVRTKDKYYVVSLLPAAALVSAVFVRQLKGRLVRIALVTAIVFIGLGQYFIISYGDGSVKMIMAMRVAPSRFLLGGMWSYPRRGDWKLQEIFGSIARNSAGKKNVLLAFEQDKQSKYWHSDNNIILNRQGIMYQVKQRRIPCMVSNIHDQEWSNMEEPDYVLSPVAIEDIKQSGVQLKQAYRQMGVFQMPDKSRVYVYER